MGRKRTSKKEQISVSVDSEIIEKLREYEVNRSVLFTEAALKYLEELESQKENKTKNE